MIDCMLADTLGDKKVREQVEALQRTGKYAAEVKWDGQRCMARVVGGRVVELRARRGLEGGKPKPSGAKLTHRFPEVVASLPNALPPKASVVLDGEVGYTDPARVKMDFSELQHRPHTDLEGIGIHAKTHPMTFVVFDILEQDGASLLSRPYSERHEVVQQVVTPNERVHVSEQSFDLVGLFDHVCALGGEGIMLKHVDAPYEPCPPGPKRSKHWLKAKGPLHQDSVGVVGLTRGNGTREDLGSLILANQTARGFEYVCRAGSGMCLSYMDAILNVLPTIWCDASPLVETPRIDKPIHCWIKPGVVTASIEWAEKTPGGKSVRFPRLRGIKINGMTVI